HLIWEVMHQIWQTEIWYRAASHYGTDTVDRLALHVMKDFGVDAYGAAAILQYHRYEYYQTYALMIDAGYDFWMTTRATVSYNIMDILEDLNGLANMAASKNRSS